MTPALFHPIRSQFSRNVQRPIFVAKQIWTWVVKRATYHRFSTRSAATRQSRLHVFVVRFAVVLLVVCDVLVAPSICFFCALMSSRRKQLICFVYYHQRQTFRSQTGSLFCKLQKKMKTLLAELEYNSQPYNKTTQIKKVFLSFQAPVEFIYLV